MARLPWYGFLYRILGTQGSFLAWVVSALGVYVTATEAVLYAFNLEPRAARVSEVLDSEPSLRRLVEVSGVEIDLASALFAAGKPEEAPPGGAREGGAPAAGPSRGLPYVVIVDADDAVAKAWREVFQEIEPIRARLQRTGDDGATYAELIRLRQTLGRIGWETRASYVPARALVVVARDGAPFSLPGAPAVPPVPAGATPTAAPPEGGKDVEPPDAQARLRERFRRETLERVELIVSSVRMSAVRRGLLSALHESSRREYQDRYGVAVARAALSVGDVPSRPAAVAFAVFALTLVFLVVGLRSPPKAA